MPFQRALTPSQVRAMAIDYTVDGMQVKDLAAKYGVATRTIERYLADAGVPKRKGPRRKRKNDRRETKPRVLKPCGTNAAWQRHRRKGEYPCEACRDAHTQDNLRWEK